MPIRGISLPDSPDGSPNRGLQNPYSAHHGSNSTSRTSIYSQNSTTAMRDNLINNTNRMLRKAHSIWKKFTPLQKVLAVIALVVINVGGILFLIFNEKIFDLLEPFARKWKHTTGGWTILWALTFMTAFPPIIGYGACGTTAGFVYGIWEGWLILATASVAGSFCSFLVSRTILRKYVERLAANDKRFAALSLTLKYDGLKLLCMIRLCPLPYSLSNGAMSTFPTVHPAMYALATALVSPKLFIHVFIGSRLAAIAKSHEKMSFETKMVNWVSIAVGGLIGAFTGWYIYQKTMARARELEIHEATGVRESVRRTGAPPKQYADDPESQVAAETVAREDDTMDYFDESEGERQTYRDEANDNDDDPFQRGDGAEDEGIGLSGPRQEA